MKANASLLSGRGTKWLCCKVYNSRMQVSWDFGYQRKDYPFLFQLALPSLFISVLAPFLFLRDKCNTSLSVLQTLVEETLLFQSSQGREAEEEEEKRNLLSIGMEHFPVFSCENRAVFSDPSVCRQVLPSLGLARELQEPALARCRSRCSSAKPSLEVGCLLLPAARNGGKPWESDLHSRKAYSPCHPKDPGSAGAASCVCGSGSFKTLHRSLLLAALHLVVLLLFLCCLWALSRQTLVWHFFS